jgi:hypothetical protein
MILFKSQELKAQFDNEITSTLRNLLYALAGFLKYTFGLDLEITSMVRYDAPVLIHWYKRAADISTQNFTPEQIQKTKDWINNNFLYGDIHHDSCIFEKAGEVVNGTTSTGDHLHVQTIK